MYYLRATQGNTYTTTEALRNFYEKNSYAFLKNEHTLADLETLITFWYDVNNQDHNMFSERILRRLFVLNYAPNGMWYYFVSVYFMHHKQDDGSLCEEKFYQFLSTIIGFIWAYALTNPGVNALRTPVYREMVNIIKGKEVSFADFQFEKSTLVSVFKNHKFLNQRQITRSMVTWWAFEHKEQPLLPIDCRLDIEHIYARNRVKYEPLSKEDNLELLGNKSLLEQRINIRASDYRFMDKIKYYQGIQSLRGNKPKTEIYELLELSQQYKDFTEDDILKRNALIIDCFCKYLESYNLLK